jgi:hypothetical protein
MSSLNLAVDANPTSAPYGYTMDDPVLDWFGSAQGGCFDFASPQCFARQADPVNGDILTNFSNDETTIRDGAITEVSGITFAGGGLDFSGVNAPGNFFAMPNAFEAIEAAADTVTASTTSGSNQLVVTAAASSPFYVGSLISGPGIPAGTRITAGTGGTGTYTMSANATATATGVTVTVKNKAWFTLLWFKMPSAADWPSSGRSICGAGNYGNSIDLYTVYMITNGASKDLIVRVSTASGTSTAIFLTNAGNIFDGKICQLFGLRTESGVTTTRLRAYDDSVSLSSTPVTLVTNSASLSGLTWRFGTMTSGQINNNFNAAGSWAAIDIGACKWRLYRPIFQSTRRLPITVTPLQIADWDFADTVARGVYS